MNIVSSQCDKLYTIQNGEEPFRFDAKVAAVFSDMVNRSVPGYGLVRQMLGLISAEYAQANTRLYDLGCSLGDSAGAIRSAVKLPGCRVVAVDNSPSMLKGCKERCSVLPGEIPLDIICADIQNIRICQASVVVLNFTLQFIPPPQRPALLRKIYEGLVKDGVLVLSEKLVFSEDSEEELLSGLYYAFKRANGYSEMEISRKRAALENVLVPETLQEHREHLHEAGFSACTVWFQCLNFVSLLAWKT